MTMKSTFLKAIAGLLALTGANLFADGNNVSGKDAPASRIPGQELEQQFLSPPASARPWVYWYFMDGNLTREA